MQDHVELPSDFEITPADVRGLSLGVVSEQYGTGGLYVRLEDTLERVGLDTNELIRASMDLGFELHDDDWRTNGHAHDHLMRVALHIIELFKKDDPDLIAAAFLHDTLEDHAKELVFRLSGEEIQDETDARVRGRVLLEEFFNARVAKRVQGVTTPQLRPGENKNESYAIFVEQIADDPEDEILKCADSVENAVGNHATKEPKQQKLDARYAPVYPIHVRALYRSDSLVRGEVRDDVVEILFQGQQRAAIRMARRAINNNDKDFLLTA